VDQVAPDGSPLAFYRRLPHTGEPALIHGLLPRGASILDIGCGPGRIAGPLTELGHAVTGIDDGPAMIAALPKGVGGIVADARSVRLGRRFDAVLLLSHFVNDLDADAIVCTAAAHLVPGGIVVGETYPPDWDPSATLGRTNTLGPAEITLVRADRDGDLLDAEVRYGVDGRTWQQAFRARLLDEAALRALLERGGLRFECWLERPGWFVARPAR
jgi:SAM-dependent methyltransferase